MFKVRNKNTLVQLLNIFRVTVWCLVNILSLYVTTMKL